MKKTAKHPATSSKSAKVSQDDIISLILADHKDLKFWIKTLKDPDTALGERRHVFEDFVPALLSHAKAEEKSLYVFLKDVEDLRTEGFEGDVEHGLAEQLTEMAQSASDKDEWSAKVKVLAELVEHHIEEEEGEMLPEFRKHSDVEDRTRIGRQYLELKGAGAQSASKTKPSTRSQPASARR